MMDESYKLSPEQHEEIFANLKKEMLAETKVSTEPTIVILGGQPGSGKSRLTDIAKSIILSDRMPAIINGDEYRESHPKAKEILEIDDKKYAERTDPDVRDWTKRLFDAAIENKRNIIFEGTMRNKEPIMSTIQNLHDAGYKVHIMVMAVRGEVSRAGTVHRYEQQKAERSYGRWVVSEFYEQAYNNMPDTVRAIEKTSPIESIRVYNREYKELYRNESKDGVFARPMQSRDASAKITEERVKPLTQENRKVFNNICTGIEQKMQRRGADKQEISETKAYIDGYYRGKEDRGR